MRQVVVPRKSPGFHVHWTQHPVFQALLLPSGGFSILALLDYFLTQ